MRRTEQTGRVKEWRDLGKRKWKGKIINHEIFKFTTVLTAKMCDNINWYALGLPWE